MGWGENSENSKMASLVLNDLEPTSLVVPETFSCVHDFRVLVINYSLLQQAFFIWFAPTACFGMF
ncbi:Protein CBG27665 [Caenorhabditis briggsae]|uniref:Protein CBG27665 n=1 Tax=Caenorhabditis briggsae TaxID=6238 RepID=B6IJB0_CAEBR|nr:Protein CBG27665 [Caenorhabditis briggsae]CAR99944.1 Protein CBG27665 [Caenorhabditis briggsae]